MFKNLLALVTSKQTCGTLKTQQKHIFEIAYIYIYTHIYYIIYIYYIHISIQSIIQFSMQIWHWWQVTLVDTMNTILKQMCFSFCGIWLICLLNDVAWFTLLQSKKLNWKLTMYINVYMWIEYWSFDTISI